MEFRENKITNERYLRLSRKQRLEHLVAKRTKNFKYFKKIHKGNHFWLNTMYFSNEIIEEYVKKIVPRDRGKHYLYLGLGIAKVLRLKVGSLSLRALAQLIEEWEYYVSGTGMQSMKYVMAKPISCPYPEIITTANHNINSSNGSHSNSNSNGSNINDNNNSTNNNSNNNNSLDSNGNNINNHNHNHHILATSDVSVGLKKFNGEMVYEFLTCPIINYELNYRLIFESLCAQLSDLYKYHFLNELNYCNQSNFDTLLKLDSKIKHYIINVVAKEFTEMAQSIIANSFEQLRNSNITF